MRRIAPIIVMAALLLGLPQQARAQAGIIVSDVGVNYDFGQHITFKARIHSPSPVVSASIVFSDNFNDTVRRFPIEVGEGDLVVFRYDVVQNVLRPFTTISFWYEVGLQDGLSHVSPSYHVQYLDDRFTWQERTDTMLRMHWYEGDTTFGDALLDVARRGLDAVNALIPASAGAPVDVFVYASVADLQGALFLGGEGGVAGHADPKLGVAMLVVTPGLAQSIDMETLIPHELAHVMLYRSVGDGYASLPVWLSEGIASLAELYPNLDYELALNEASQNNSLLPMAELCDSFPTGGSRINLAYAQSQSFIRFIRDTYGISYLNLLISTYTDGLNCEQGVVRALNTSLANLDTRWRESALGQNVVGVFFRNMLPYLWLFGFLLLIPLIGFLQRRPEDDRTE